MARYRVLKDFKCNINTDSASGKAGEIVELNEAMHKRMTKGEYVAEWPEAAPQIIEVEKIVYRDGPDPNAQPEPVVEEVVEQNPQHQTKYSNKRK